MLNINQNRESGFRRLLQSGGAKVACLLLHQIHIICSLYAISQTTDYETDRLYRKHHKPKPCRESVQIVVISHGLYFHSNILLVLPFICFIFWHHSKALVVTCASSGPAQSLSILVQRGNSPVCRLQSVAAWRLQS